jgi:stage IV sporulation protein FB
MIGVDSPTPLDLRFPLGPIPVRVSFMFWLIMALLGYGIAASMPQGNTWANLLVWVACGFVSILIHELGHAVAFRLFGSWSAITLHGFGGFAEAPHPPRSAGARMLVAMAGPAAGFALAGLAYFGLEAVGWKGEKVALHPYALNALFFLFVMNLFWNALNLLPILPLDGGRVCREFLALMRVRSADVIAHGIGFTIALALAVYGGLCLAQVLPAEVRKAIPRWAEPGIFMTLWFALFAVDNYQRMQLARRQMSYYQSPDDDYDDDTPPWRRR